MMHTESITEQLHSLSIGKYSSKELTENYFERIKQFKHLNCYISVMEEFALRSAADADRARREGRISPLTGIPIAHKDIFCTKNFATTAGSKMLHNYIAPFDATVVQKIASAGAITLGKTNMDEFAMGSSNETSYYGAVQNPWDTDRVPGGSSGGSAAAVAAGLCSAATGTDTGGSIRQPSAHCGITGLKPTYGRISRWGMIAFASSLDQAGPMTRTAEDAALMLAVMAGGDPRDSTCINDDVPTYLEYLNNTLEGTLVGICDDFFADGLEAKSQEVIQDALKIFEQLGAKIQSVKLPHIRYSVPAYYVIAPAEASTNLSRYDGVRFGYRCEDPENLNDMFKRSRSEGFGDEVKRRIMTGAFTLSTGYYDAYYRKAQQIRRLIKNDFDQVFNEVDFLVGPTAPQPAFLLGEKTENHIEMYLQDIYTIAANLAGLPAMSIPVGFSSKLPVGLQLIGNYLAEGTILTAAHQYQQRTDWHKCFPRMTTSESPQ